MHPALPDLRPRLEGGPPASKSSFKAFVISTDTVFTRCIFLNEFVLNQITPDSKSWVKLTQKTVTNGGLRRAQQLIFCLGDPYHIVQAMLFSMLFQKLKPHHQIFHPICGVSLHSREFLDRTGGI